MTSRDKRRRIRKRTCSRANGKSRRAIFCFGLTARGVPPCRVSSRSRCAGPSGRVPWSPTSSFRRRAYSRKISASLGASSCASTANWRPRGTSVFARARPQPCGPGGSTREPSPLGTEAESSMTSGRTFPTSRPFRASHGYEPSASRWRTPGSPTSATAIRRGSGIFALPSRTTSPARVASPHIRRRR